jgi:hypothetical protein
MDSIVCCKSTLHVGVNGRLRYQTVEQINGNNVINVDFSNGVNKAAA